jgi:heptosyltransferase-2
VSSERILVVGPSWVGDMVMAQSLFIEQANRFPGCSIDVLAPAWSLPVIARMPQVRAGVVADVAHGEFALGKRRKIGHQLRDNHYTRAIVLPRSFKSALVPWFASIPRRTGFRGEMRFGLLTDIRELDRTKLDQTVKRFVVLGREPGDYPENVPFPELAVSAENQERLISELALSDDRPAVALLPGAEYGPAKCWPLENYSELSRMLDGIGCSVWVMGSDKDKAAGDAIANDGPAINLCGKTGLADAIDLLAHCEHAISNDSGLMHIAAAVGTCTHAIYGSSTPTYTPPLTDNAVIHYLGLECSPCFERDCPLQHLNCLRGITVQAVFDGVAEHSKSR